MARDTPTGILIGEEAGEAPAPTRQPSRRYTPQQIGDVLDSWARKP